MASGRIRASAFPSRDRSRKASAAASGPRTVDGMAARASSSNCRWRGACAMSALNIHASCVILLDAGARSVRRPTPEFCSSAKAAPANLTVALQLDRTWREAGGATTVPIYSFATRLCTQRASDSCGTSRGTRRGNRSAALCGECAASRLPSGSVPATARCPTAKTTNRRHSRIVRARSATDASFRLRHRHAPKRSFLRPPPSSNALFREKSERASIARIFAIVRDLQQFSRP